MSSSDFVPAYGNNAPGIRTSFERMPGHWVLASLGKRVLRPGGMSLTRWMLGELSITGTDSVVELAPGIGATARLILSQCPRRYTAVDSDKRAVRDLARSLEGHDLSFIHAQAQSTGLPDRSATVVVGEAFLTMQSESVRKKILAEMARLLPPGGRLGIHELCVTSADPDRADRIRFELSKALRVNANPLTISEWRSLLPSSGFTVLAERTRPMELLRVQRLIGDEGIWGTFRIAVNSIRNRAAARRVLEMRRVFEKYSGDLAAISLVSRRSD